MKVVHQFSITGENKEGVLASVIQHLAYGGVNILGIIIVDRGEIGVIRLITNDPIRSERIFKETGIEYRIVEVLAVRMPDSPGALLHVANILAENTVNIDYVYPLVGTTSQATVIFKTRDLERTFRILVDNQIEVLDNSELLGG